MTPRYLVLHTSDPTGTPLSREEDQRMLEDWASEGEATGRLHDGAPVAAPEEARSVTVREERVLVTDGPFPEFKEWFAGFDVITAESIAEATAFMARHPLAVQGRVLVLPLVRLPWEDEG